VEDREYKIPKRWMRWVERVALWLIVPPLVVVPILKIGFYVVLHPPGQPHESRKLQIILAAYDWLVGWF
jgi:hypothetical protein